MLDMSPASKQLIYLAESGCSLSCWKGLLLPELLQGLQENGNLVGAEATCKMLVCS